MGQESGDILFAFHSVEDKDFQEEQHPSPCDDTRPWNSVLEQELSHKVEALCS